MLYVIYGDREEVVKKTQELCAGIRTYGMDTDSLDYTTLDNYVSGGGLFNESHGVYLDGCYTDEEHTEAIKERMQDFADSDTIVVIREEKLYAKDKKYFNGIGAEIIDLSTPAEKQKNTELFAVTDAYSAGDKKNLWTNYHKALRAGYAPEEIHGVLWWQIKNLVIVKETNKNPGVHNFVYGKLQNSRITAEQAHNDARRLIDALYVSRSSNSLELEDTLELWVVS